MPLVFEDWNWTMFSMFTVSRRNELVIKMSYYAYKQQEYLSIKHIEMELHELIWWPWIVKVTRLKKNLF